jgi:hypothetical protein
MEYVNMNDARQLIAKTGNLEVRKCAGRKDIPWDAKHAKKAASGCHLETLKYAYENGYPRDKTTCCTAALYEHQNSERQS